MDNTRYWGYNSTNMNSWIIFVDVIVKLTWTWISSWTFVQRVQCGTKNATVCNVPVSCIAVSAIYFFIFKLRSIWEQASWLCFSSSNGSKRQSAHEKSQSITVDYWLCLGGILDMICDTGNHHVGQSIITVCNEPCRNYHVRTDDGINGSNVRPDRFCHILLLGWIVTMFICNIEGNRCEGKELVSALNKELSTTLPSLKMNE